MQPLGPWYVDQFFGHVVTRKDNSLNEGMTGVNDIALIKGPNARRKEIASVISAAPELLKAVEWFGSEDFSFETYTDERKQKVAELIKKAKGLETK